MSKSVFLFLCKIREFEKTVEWIITKLGQVMDLGQGQVRLHCGDLDLKVKVTRSQCVVFIRKVKNTKIKNFRHTIA